MHSSAPDFGVYNSTGKLLAGNKNFEEYAELAKQLDIKRSALYVETRKGEIFLGCSLLVKITRGREERVVFIASYAPEEITYDTTSIFSSSAASTSISTSSSSTASTSISTPASSSIPTSDMGLIKRFYREAKSHVENLETIRYQVLGLWEAGDLEGIHTTGVPTKSIAYPAGKLLSGQRVSVRTSDLSNGIPFIGSLISKFSPLNFLDFSFALSLSPSPVDSSVSPGEPDPDFYLESGEVRPYPGQPSYSGRYYELLYESFSRLVENPDFQKHFQTNSGGREEFFERVLESLLENNASEAIDTFASSGAMDSFFGLYRKNPKALKIIVEALLTTHRADHLVIIHDEELAADLITALGEVQPANNKRLEAFLMELYRRLDDQEQKIRIHRHFLEKNIFYENFIAELMQLLENASHVSQGSPDDSALLRLCASASFYGNRREKEAFETGVKKGLAHLSPSNEIDFLKYVINALEMPGEGGKVLLEALIPERATGMNGLKGDAYYPTGNDFILKLRENEVQKLDKWLGRHYLKERKMKKSQQVKKTIKYACSFLLIVIVGLLILLKTFPEPKIPSVTFSENNSTGILPFTIQFENTNFNKNKNGVNESIWEDHSILGDIVNETGGNATDVNSTEVNSAEVNSTEVNLTKVNSTEVNETT
ncbi:hypothetical protein [Methanosarcina sp. 1.H.A.2.2]|uniref:hypothetical protein n=1 Tax=Methanosarcina sp. 1.H.A.2.2 TaxID=1483601 RepID=UPI00062275DC|nr:hypothetical protein [Methanosarcina sp. 1.H.A.2.2]KKH46960.1 hypothetical protein EO93_06555 [Methanosarcina sp. 1.H.A.2.2]